MPEESEIPIIHFGLITKLYVRKNRYVWEINIIKTIIRCKEDV